jgi:uncharacterized protein (TIGR02391 family)
MSNVSIFSILPDPKALLALEPEELAGVILQYLNSIPETDRGQLNRYNFSLPHTVQEYPPEYRNQISQALMEAWVWLEREGLLAPKPGSQGEWVFITRRGKKLTTAEDLKSYKRGDVLPRNLLHPRLAQKVWASFLRGDYDAAVFQAFKEVEVRVREASNFADTDIGVPLMRKAFEAGKGPLSDTSAPNPEQESLAHLFAGAIGSYKNPHSHRSVNIEAGEAVEMIMLASHLLNIIEKRGSM